MKRRVLVCASCALKIVVTAAVSNSILDAQDTGRLSDSPWRWTWTPLRPIGGLGLPGAITFNAPGMLELPKPVVGQSWSARNPAAFVDDIREPYTRLTLGAHGVQGTYRVATNPARFSAFAGEYGGWRRLQSRSAVIGRVAVERAIQAAGEQAVLIAPDLSSPFVPADTNAPPTARTRVILEGGQSVQLGRWRLGVALGYEGMSDNAERSTIGVVRRSAVGGASAGVALTIGMAGRVGLSARRISRNETANIFANPGTARLYLLDGFVNVKAQDYVLEAPPFFRRADRSGNALSVDASGLLWSAAWSGWVGYESTDERQVGAVATNTPVQRWGTAGYDGGAAVQRTFGELLVSAVATGKIQRGETERPSATARQFEADANRLTLISDVRWTPQRPAWAAAATIQVGRQWQRATDRAARTSTDITAWSPGVSVELAREASNSWSYSAGVGVGFYTPYATIPSINGRSASYLTLVASALELAAAPARTNTLSFTVRWRRTASTVVMRTSWCSTAATQRAIDAIYLPQGYRAQWTVALSLLPRGSG